VLESAVVRGQAWFQGEAYLLLSLVLVVEVLHHGRDEKSVLALLDEWRLDCQVSLAGVRVVVVFLDGQRSDCQVSLVDGLVERA
jgi:hypothetical protein